MVPTPLAEEVFQRLAGALTTVYEVVYGSAVFDPAKSERTIRLGLPDDLEIVILPILIDVLRRKAPGLRLIVRPADFRTIPAQLDSGDIDVAISASPIAPSAWHVVERLCQDGFVCIYDPRKMKLKGRITLKQYLSRPHVLVSARGELSGPMTVSWRRWATTGES